MSPRKTIIIGVNEVGTTHPEVAKEWHPTKNGSLKPSDFTYGSREKMWWLCPKGHEYQATIGHRTCANPTSCPICNSQRQTSFAEQAFYFYIKKMYPDAINRYKSKETKRFEFDIYIPSINTAIEYDGEAWHKVNKFEREQRKYELCQSLNIRLLRLREGKLPSYYRDICDDMFAVKNLYKHEILNLAIDHFLSVIEPKDYASLFNKSRNIFELKSYDVDVNRDRYEILKYVTGTVKNSVFECKPELVEEWHPTKNGHIKPEFVAIGSTVNYWWKCKECGYEYEMSPAKRKNGGGCPECTAKYQGITTRMNSVKRKGPITNPILLKEWNYARNGSKRPEFYTKASDDKVWWKCSKCGYEWEAKISNREHGKGCPCCAHRVCIKGINDLETNFPELVKEWDYEKNSPLTPDQVVTGSKQMVWWICPVCGYSYRAPVFRRTQGSGCRKCADKKNPNLHRKALIKKNGSFGSNYPDLLKEFSEKNMVNPFEITTGYTEKVLWKCPECNNEWWAVIRSRIKGHGCPLCAIRKSRASVKNIETGIVYESITIAAKETGVDAKAISSNCRGRTKHAGGYHWEYVSNRRV